MMFRVRRISAAVVYVLGTNASSAQSPSIAGGEFTEKITVTGTRIPGVERETGLPVQIITRDAIERANIQTAAELVNTVSANVSYGSFTENQAPAGSTQPGLAAAGLRGLNYQRTLVLLNGRRLATYVFTGSAVDLNIIPIAALDRVEVLLDGASAIYGSDAIGGVINFITRNDYEGAQATAQYSSPERTGGYSDHFNVSAGYGSLAQQRFNLFGTVDYQQFGGVAARDRPFSRSYYIPGVFDQTSNASFPANVAVGPNDFRSPTGTPGNGYRDPSCVPPISFPTASAPSTCRLDAGYFINDIAPSERIAATGSFTWQLTPEDQLFFNGLYARNRFTFLGTPASVSRAFLQPSSAFYPSEFATFFHLTPPLNTGWRALELGPRTDEPTVEQWNAVAGLRGAVAGWSYEGALSYGQSSVDDRYTGGYLFASVINPLLNSGRVNPFGYNTPDIVSLMSDAVVNQTVRTGTSTISSADFHASREVYALPAGPLSVAVGAEARQLRLTETSSQPLATGDIITTSGAVPSMHATRNIWAVFGEISVPITKTFEADLAVRFDHYSDVGSTTNPKLSLRWQPEHTIVVRASVGTGFRAPGLEGLYEPPILGTTSPFIPSDPARCPITHSAQDCNVNYQTQSGGNPALQNEKSKQWGAGVVWAPLPSLTLGVDYFDVQIDNLIFQLNAQTIFQLCPDGINGNTCSFLVRGPVDPTYPTLPGPIQYINTSLFNLGTTRVTGVDVNAEYRFPKLDWGQFRLSLQGTYNFHYWQQQTDGSYLDQVNHELQVPSVGAIPYWHHYLTLDWSYGPWSATLTENYQTGTYDQSPNPGETQLRKIGDYDIWNLSASYSGFKQWLFSIGVKNLANRDPPYTNQTRTAASGAPAGYDPTYTDPRGRVYWASVRFSFR